MTPKSTPDPPERNASKTGILQAQVEDAKDDVSEERADRRDMTEGRIQDLKDTIDSLQEDKDKIGNQFKWMFRMFVAENFLILVMFGVAVGVVQDGEVSVPFVGTIEVGMNGLDESMEATQPLPSMSEDTGEEIE